MSIKHSGAIKRLNYESSAGWTTYVTLHKAAISLTTLITKRRAIGIREINPYFTWIDTRRVMRDARRSVRFWEWGIPLSKPRSFSHCLQTSVIAVVASLSSRPYTSRHPAKSRLKDPNPPKLGRG